MKNTKDFLTNNNLAGLAPTSHKVKGRSSFDNKQKNSSSTGDKSSALSFSFPKEEQELMHSLLGRPPSIIEQALFSALWSEHCSYKSSKIHLKKFAQKSTRVVSEFGENAGVIDIGQGERVAFKMESHNHPSRIVPFHGAMTGVGGILRDIFAMNARPVALANYLCFGDIKYPITKGLMDGVVQGIGGYGNCIGLPTITGHTEFHSSYNENILVNAFALGVYQPQDKIMTSQTTHVGSYVVYVGAQTGRDGIQGASMASESFGEEKKQKSTVQVGDPFFGKLLMEACLEVMKKGLVLSSQDMGAAGLISSSFEMASKGKVGMNLHLDRVPLRDSTMTPEEILLSESQERMVLVCSPENYPHIEKIFKKWNLPVCVLGEVISERKMKLFWKEKLLTAIDPLLFTEKSPEYKRPYKKWSFPNQIKDIQQTCLPKTNVSDVLLEILKSSQGCSRQSIYQQYDQRVGASTAGDCSFPIGIIQLAHSKRFVGLALGGRPHILKMDSFIGGQDAVLYPSLQLACRGFEPLAVTDCLNFGNPEKEEIMSQFVACVEGMAESCQKLSTPVISGNVSFYNESGDQNIIPTSGTGVVGLNSRSSWPFAEFQKTKDKIYLVHLHQCFSTGMLAEYLKQPVAFYGRVESVEFHQWIKVLQNLCPQYATSARVVGKFGLLYTLARMTLKGIGAHAQCDLDPFQERLYEVVLTVSPEKQEAFEKELNKYSLDYKKIGQTISNQLIYDKNQWSLEDIQKSYQTSLI